MSEHPLHVMILWHMHQPYYKDLSRNEYMMPWVGLHATKDYLDMALLAGEYPNLRVTFNMVPSLLEQIEEYAAGQAHDLYLGLALKNAEALDEEERVLLLRNFFSAHYHHMIQPYPRYRELHKRRGWDAKSPQLPAIAKTFSVAELRDLQVWFYLSWIDPMLREADPRLRALEAQGRLFSEEDKLGLIAITRELTGRIIPTLKDLWARGQIELSTTPYFHPILPLLVDTDIARRSRPRAALPTRRFQHPEDARLQIELGLAYCEKLFGRRPTGLWPSEGSVCPELVPMFAQAGLRWAATDEDVLAASLGFERFSRDRNGQLEAADALYRPYLVSQDGAQVALFFRDHLLSDLIGFKYAHWEPRAAAGDLIHRLEEVQLRLRDQAGPHVVSIILDGENCWEHYERDGEPFLRALYEGLSNHRELRTVTPSEYLAAFPEQRALERLHSGSWINRDFSIWLGHAEDNASWDVLGQTREDVSRRLDGDAALAPVSVAARQAALKSLLIAEGSDWNWWYGDDHSSDYDDEFDALYRQHLRNAYEVLGLKVPGRLYIPINARREAGLQTAPCAFITPTIDGRVSSYYEWFSAGRFDPRQAGDAMHQAEPALAGLYYGFDRQHFYLRLDFSESFGAEQREGAHLILYLFAGLNFKIACPAGGAGPGQGRVFQEQEGRGWVEAGPFDQYAIGVISEFAFSRERFRIAVNEMLRFQAAIEVEEREVERCPSRAPLATTAPDEHFEEIQWIV